MKTQTAIRSHPDAVAFRNAAARFCEILETLPNKPDEWVGQLLSALSNVYAHAHHLPNFGLSEDALEVPDSFDVSDAEWKQVCSRVHSLLNRQNGYWCYFDPTQPPDDKEAPVFGDLGDDLADIYRNLKPGVRAWDSNDDALIQSVVFDWVTPLFGCHWGLHAVDAMRALHQIVFLRGIQNGE